MGLSGSKSSSTTKPVYDQQITGAANNITSAYNAQQPKLTAVTDAIGTLTPDLLSRFRDGTPVLNAAQNYITSTLAGPYTQNPELSSIIARTNDSIRNQTEASLGTRGLTGGSDYAGIIGKNVGDNTSNLLYTDYNNWLQRQAQAASMAPSIDAASYLPINALGSVASAQQMPVQSAAGAGAGVGGLLGQYTNSTQKTSQGLGSILGSVLGSGLAGWASGGFKGI